MGIVEGKKFLVTGVLTTDSLAFGTARLAQLEGADVILTGFGRGMSLTTRTAKRLPETAEVLELDVTNTEHPRRVAGAIAQRFGRLDGILHSIAYAPESAIGHGMFEASWSDVASAIEVSVYSLRVLAKGFISLLEAAPSASIVGLDFDAQFAWPGYDWMGVSKAALESLTRYLSRDLGPKRIRVNLVAAGPVRTVAAKAIPGFSRFEDAWSERAPLGWSVSEDADAVAKACVALMSDWFPKTTGEIVHVDGGFHAVGA
ncbi:MAG: enoyl-ACP reductase FabI [Acidimicrobiales bacterium]